MSENSTARMGARVAPLIADLGAALAAEGVRYCHWKSNAFLHRVLQGDDDLDLLVDRADAELFAGTLRRLGFREAIDDAGAVPGIAHYYGYDHDSERFIHVHAHYWLVMGDDLTKSFRLPLERAFLESATSDDVLPVPLPELELVTLVVRLVLKHATWDAILAGRGDVSERAYRELAYLEERVAAESIARLLAEWLPALDYPLFQECRDALQPLAGRLRAVRAGHRLVAVLVPFARRPRSADVALKLWRRGAGIGRRVLRRPARRKRLTRGGLVIAIVGGDGAGKSTAVEGLQHWLSPPFAASAVHLGKPRRSLPTRVVGVVVSGLSKLSLGDPSRIRAVNALMLARDRCRAVRAVRRRASRGELVLCDRYPLPQLALMDAPRIPTVSDRGGVWRRRRLSALERRYYRAMTSPDLVIVLRVNPEVAVVRRVDEDPDSVRARWREIWDLDWRSLGAHVVDAERPPAEVLAELKALVWSQL